jgi:MFS family permease
MQLLIFLRRAAPALGFGFLLTLGSSAGQTFFISLSAGDIQRDLGLSHGAFGALYTIATTTSAVALVWLGKLADRFELARLGAATLAMLALTCSVLMANVASVPMLVLALFGLRLAGQGMLSHLALTAMGRWFSAERGRALSVAIMGFTAGEAFLPFVVATALVMLASWRHVWMIAGVVLALVFVPLVLVLGHEVRRRGLDHPSAHAVISGEPERPSWTRAQVLRDPRFFALLPGVLAPPFIITGVLFHQVHLVAVKGWTLPAFAALYPLFAGASTAVVLGLGWLVDRFGSRRILPFYLLPIAAGLGLLSISDSLTGAGAFMVLMGATSGGATIVLGALWAELYGVAHLGAIRALAVSLMVLSTALAPGAMGGLIDAGVSLDVQFRAMALYVLLCVAVFAALQPALQRDAAPG